MSNENIEKIVVATVVENTTDVISELNTATELIDKLKTSLYKIKLKSNIYPVKLKHEDLEKIAEMVVEKLRDEEVKK